MALTLRSPLLLTVLSRALVCALPPRRVNRERARALATADATRAQSAAAATAKRLRDYLYEGAG
jgi:hypothetical protein